MTERNKTAKSETERRVELNRALDFITDEVRQAKSIATNAITDVSAAPGFDSTGKTPVLILKIPNVSQRVVYYIASASSPWLGPKVIYRWGPGFDNNGQYSNPENNPVTGNNNPANWQGNALVDLVVDSTPSPNSNCPTSWSAIPSVASRQGFYVCVDPDGRIADIHLRSKLINAYNNSTTPFEVSTKAFSRPYDVPSSGSGGGSGSGSSPFTTTGGTINITQPSDVSIQVLGGEITCGSPGPVINTTTAVNVTPSGGSTTITSVPSSTQSLSLPNVATGSTVSITGTALATSCIGSQPSYNSATNVGTQVLTLRNGDRPPLFTPYGNQRSVDNFLNAYINQDTGRVRLADNQVIFLFELGTTDRATTAYDVQDLVVLANISPR